MTFIRKLAAGAIVAAATLLASGAYAQQKPITLGFSQVGAESAWRTANTVSIKSAAKDAGINLKFSDAQQKQENQIRAIRSFIAQKVDVIGRVLAGRRVGLGAGAQRSEGRAHSGDPDRSRRRREGSVAVRDDDRLGLPRGRPPRGPLARRALQERRGPDQHRRAAGHGRLGAGQRSPRGPARSDQEQSEKFKVIASQSGDFTLAGGKQVMEAFAKTYGKQINVVYAHNDDMALGAIQAMEEAGIKPGKDVSVVSFDATKAGFQAMIAGKINVDVECSPLLGPQLMTAVKDVVAGKQLPKRIVTNETVFPMNVAAQVLPTRKY
ncbi:Periplasmic binding protein/LacI transcriptional regulator [Burkholderia dolosa AU0158]|nr:Periplasmic binding protein/LacI transcriptional regulator [Burkholderia dolosa AU0158]